MNLIDEWKTIVPAANKDWAQMCDHLKDIDIQKMAIWPDENRKHLSSLYLFPLIDKTPNFVLIIPGGAFLFKSVHEALPVAAAFHQAGYNAAILDYRCRPYSNEEICSDGIRGIQVLRHYINSLGLDNPHLITLGFSAGGILTSLVNINAHKGYDGLDDDISREPILPDAEIMIYGAFTDTGIIDHPTRCYNRLCGYEQEEVIKDASESILLQLPMKLPPAFMAQTDNDDPLFILEMAKAWRMRGIPCEAHLFMGGGHGGGLYDGLNNTEENKHDAHWFELCCEWINSLFMEE